MIKSFFQIVLLFFVIPGSLGAFSNIVAVVANGGAMPVDFDNCIFDGCEEMKAKTIQAHAKGIGRHQIMSSNTRFQFLVDKYVLIYNYQSTEEKQVVIWSIGDFFITAGCINGCIIIFWLLVLWLGEFIKLKYYL